jgi:hypothetical protein
MCARAQPLAEELGSIDPELRGVPDDDDEDPTWFDGMDLATYVAAEAIRSEVRPTELAIMMASQERTRPDLAYRYVRQRIDEAATAVRERLNELVVGEDGADI